MVVPCDGRCQIMTQYTSYDFMTSRDPPSFVAIALQRGVWTNCLSLIVMGLITNLITSLFTIDSVIFFLYQYLSTRHATNAIIIPMINTRYTPNMLFKPILLRDNAEREEKC